MIPNETTHIFTPFWLQSLSVEERNDVTKWLVDAGVNTFMCPGFDYDGQLITTRYYARNEMGGPMCDEDMNPIYEDQVREFPAPHAPKAVQELRKHA